MKKTLYKLYNPDCLEQCKIVYTGDGFILKAKYKEFGDKSGYYIAGFELSRYSVPLFLYPIPKDIDCLIEDYIDILSEKLNTQLEYE